MEDYASLKGDLESFIKSRGSVSAGELVEWAKRKGISEITLYVLVQELLESGEFRGEGEPQVIEPVINIEVPSRVVYVKKAVQPARPARAPTPRKTSRKKTRAVSSHSLLKFLQAEVESEAEEPEHEEAGIGGVEGEAPSKEAPARTTATEKEGGDLSGLEDLLKDADFSKAIRYLGRYWSVGKLRFLSDMVNDGVELGKAEKILLELRRRRLVELTENNVINAGEELRKLYRRTQSSLPLYDLFEKT
ncbi:hypothetical protein IG193_02655 [Infirmifilum lucidum]|uniref:Uncharacterized protein n=1 Tax=Infirmifilum lucidum TaxID=2776706 RepID=A0A7L9FIB8_9CREN|nr:hypothetical protein [Infirmifilum lucidum]QOJ79381.1 hypothetical protein IG193_02655 [Infirmifilum lucidum]